MKAMTGDDDVRRWRFVIGMSAWAMGFAGVFVTLWLLTCNLPVVLLHPVLGDQGVMVIGHVLNLARLWIAVISGRRIASALIRTSMFGSMPADLLTAKGLKMSFNEMMGVPPETEQAGGVDESPCAQKGDSETRQAVPQQGSLRQPVRFKLPTGPAEVRVKRLKARVVPGLESRRISASSPVRPPTEQIVAGVSFEKRYQIIGPLGEGGAGVVYRAYDTVLNIPVALKVISSAVLNDPDSEKSFIAEARIAMKLTHPGIVRIFNMEKAGSGYFLVMEFVDGMSLADSLEMAGRLNEERLWRVVDACCEALEYAHGQGVLHNDLKPENIMLTKTGGVKLIDFGVAQLHNARTEYIAGTPQYMSPEQIQCGQLDAGTDVYAMGVMVFELLTGRQLFGDDMSLDARRTLNPVVFDGMDHSLARVIIRATAFDRAERYDSIADFRAALLGAIAVTTANV